MNLYPSEHEGHKAWLYLLHMLFLHGLTNEEANAFSLNDFVPSSFELHADDVHCFRCASYLGHLSSSAMNIPTYCHACSKEVLNIHWKHHHALIEMKAFFRYSHVVRAHNYLIKTVKEMNKGTYHVYTS